MKRLCPKCGKKTQEARCPDDGTATLVLAQNPDAKLAEGTEVNGRYRIGAMIGQGGFGAVYKAKNLATDQDIAIKLLAVALESDDSDVIQRFFAEAQVTASLKHPNTIRVFDFGQTEGGALYIAMELLTGRPLNEELRDRLGQGRTFTQDEIINIGGQVLRSLAEAHVANLVHRDLKPHNIFMHDVDGDDPVVKVLDFGIAKRLGSNLTGTGKAFGTPTYMSPEQAQNRPLDRRSDLYSLGCVLFQLAAGRPPFDGENPLAVLLSHVTDPPPDLRLATCSPLSEALIRVIERAMAKHPDDRFASAVEMRQALDACRGAEVLRSALHEPPRLVAGATQGADQATEGYDAPQMEARTAAYATPGQFAPPVGRVPLAATVDVSAPAGPRPAPMIPPPPSGVASVQLPAVAGPEANAPASARQDRTGPTADEVDVAASMADDEPLPKASSPVKWLVLLAIVAVVVVGGWLALGDSASPPAPSEPSAPPAVAPAPAPPPATEPATPPAAPAPVAAAPTAVGPVEVKLVSEPPGAQVQIAGKDRGRTPLSVTVTTKTTALLHLDGYIDREVDIEHNDAPQLRVELRKFADAAGKPAGGTVTGTSGGATGGPGGAAKVKTGSGGAKSTDKVEKPNGKNGPSALDERL